MRRVDLTGAALMIGEHQVVAVTEAAQGQVLR
jgi:hypothetical protein